MRAIRLLVLLGLGTGLGACATTDTATRNAPSAALAEVTAPAPLSVADLSVRVPNSLTVSEANRYLPGSDIVWREDPLGDRHAQVAAIVTEAMRRGTAPLDGPRAVDVDIEITRFHALTEKARYVTGGVHAVDFVMTVTDAETGAPVGEPRRINADLPAFGGQRALDAERRGLTQKVRISDHLARVIRMELTEPGSYERARHDIYQAMRRL